MGMCSKSAFIRNDWLRAFPEGPVAQVVSDLMAFREGPEVVLLNGEWHQVRGLARDRASGLNALLKAVK